MQHLLALVFLILAGTINIAGDSDRHRVTRLVTGSSIWHNSPLNVQVHRIQNKKLWKHFAFHYSNMQERWSHEPGLNLVNGGRPQLWHGTSSTEAQQVYATEQGTCPSSPPPLLGQSVASWRWFALVLSH